MISSGLMTKSGIRIYVLVALGGLVGLSLFLTPTASGQNRPLTIFSRYLQLSKSASTADVYWLMMKSALT
jgi:hypothetical protein